MKYLTKWLSLLLVAALFLTGCAVELGPPETETRIVEAAAPESLPWETAETALSIDEDGHYTSKEDVALYLYTFGHLPDNFITKKDAEALGWGTAYKTLDKAAPGMSIGGTYFGNYEKLLPTAKGRKYFECDIDYSGGSRSGKRIVYSNDGLIYYTEDHYQTFELLYGEE